jgi:hypothetical protein
MEGKLDSARWLDGVEHDKNPATVGLTATTGTTKAHSA